MEALDRLQKDFIIKTRQYRSQYAGIYYLRLTILKPIVKARGQSIWANSEIGGQPAPFKERILDVRQGKPCWIVGSVFVDMELKPNVLEDLAKDVSFIFGRRGIYSADIACYWVAGSS